MIKPFKILLTKQLDNGNTGVLFESTKSVIELDKAKEQKITTAIEVLPGENIDLTIFNYLKDSGWLK